LDDRGMGVPRAVSGQQGCASRMPFWRIRCSHAENDGQSVTKGRETRAGSGSRGRCRAEILLSSAFEGRRFPTDCQHHSSEGRELTVCLSVRSCHLFRVWSCTHVVTTTTQSWCQGLCKGRRRHRSSAIPVAFNGGTNVLST
jgi:hypothetical protein